MTLIYLLNLVSLLSSLLNRRLSLPTSRWWFGLRLPIGSDSKVIVRIFLLFLNLGTHFTLFTNDFPLWLLLKYRCLDPSGDSGAQSGWSINDIDIEVNLKGPQQGWH